MPESPFKALVSTLALLWVTGPVQAFEFGAASTTAVLGAPLEFEVELRWAPGDEAALRCVAADVAMGGVLVAPRGVSVGLSRSDAGASVRVRTAAGVNDPVVGVVVSVGCPARLTRRFTVLADPPATGWAVQSVPLAQRQDGAGLSAAASRPAPLGRAVRESPAGAGHAAPPGIRATDLPPDASTATPAMAQAAVQSRSRLEVGASVVRSSRGEAAPALAPAAGSGGAAMPVGGASTSAVLANSSDAAASAAMRSPDVATVVPARVQSLENSLLALRIESRQQRDALARLEVALGEAQSQSRLAWSTAGLLAVALSVVAALGLRRGRNASGIGPRSELAWPPHVGLAPPEPALGPVEPVARESSERSATADLSGAPGGAGRDEAREHGTPVEVTATGGYAVGATAPPAAGEGESAMERTRLMAPSVASISAPLHTVPVEEILDLEQQVEFLTVLGREDSATALLIEHLSKTGGTHPTPFLRLMELHRRRGEREAYEHLRTRFNQRFNAVAAAFGAGTAPQRTLQDCPELMQSIEQAWPRPVDAMTLLENLMFRSAAKEPLDIATLEDVVFLHTLARDLDERDVGSSSPVDVLLPLDEVAVHTSRVAADGDVGLALLQPEVETPTNPTAGSGGAKTHSDPWPSISGADFNVDGIEMEPLANLPRAKSPPGLAG